MITLIESMFINEVKQAFERLKRTPPIVNAWLEINDGSLFKVGIECKNDVPINYVWHIGTFAKDSNEQTVRIHVSAPSRGYQSYHPLLDPTDPKMIVDE
jgi:hypothetical protein